MPKPVPQPDEVTKPFWDAANQGRLVGQRCRDCQKYQHPPQKACPKCGSQNLEFVPLSGRGTIYSYSIIHDTRVSGLIPYQPFPCVAVELEESPDLMMLTSLPGTASKDIQIGAAVQVEFEEVKPGRRIPQFRVLNTPRGR